MVALPARLMRIGRIAAWTDLVLVVAAGGLVVAVPPLRDAVLAPRPTLTRTLPPAAGSALAATVY